MENEKGPLSLSAPPPPDDIHACTCETKAHSVFHQLLLPVDRVLRPRVLHGRARVDPVGGSSLTEVPDEEAADLLVHGRRGGV